MAIQDLLAGTLSWGSSGTSSGKEPLSFSCKTTRELLFNTAFFLILQALICSLTVKLYDASCPGSGKVQLKNSEKCHVHYVEHFSWKTQLNFMSTRWKGFTREMYYISWPRIENV